MSNQLQTHRNDLKSGAKFLGKKFVSRPDEPTVNCGNLSDEEHLPNIEEVAIVVKHVKLGKATGPDSIPIDFVVSFDSILHSYLLISLRRYEYHRNNAE